MIIVRMYAAMAHPLSLIHILTNMFIRPTAEELEAYGVPDFVDVYKRQA